ncbi:MAG TPA: hypothetical protein VGI22_07165 [Xanthobacteraceae bacterium]|jgi:hypothetical protein
MKTRAKSWLVSTSSAFAIALLAFSLTVGGSRAVRANDPETVSYPGQETVLVPVKDLQLLEQRVAYLEESVTALTASWQHIDTHRLCVSDEAGASETCITKAQLDGLLASQATVAAAPAPAAVVEEAKTSPAEEPVTVAATEESEPTSSAEGNPDSEKDPGTEPVVIAEDKSEPAPSPVADQVAQKDSESELVTGSIATTEHAAEVSPAPVIEPLAEGADLP